MVENFKYFRCREFINKATTTKEVNILLKPSNRPSLSLFLFLIFTRVHFFIAREGGKEGRGRERKRERERERERENTNYVREKH